jgi:hypothetical protein
LEPPANPARFKCTLCDTATKIVSALDVDLIEGVEPKQAANALATLALFEVGVDLAESRVAIGVEADPVVRDEDVDGAGICQFRDCDVDASLRDIVSVTILDTKHCITDRFEQRLQALRGV